MTQKKKGAFSWMFKQQENEETVKEAVPPPIPVHSIQKGSPDMDYINGIKSLLEKSNEKGLDYYEFSKSIESMSSQPLTEQQKFSVVFATFSAAGIKVKDIIDSAKRYLQVVNNYEAEFHLEWSRTFEQDVTKKESDVKQKEAKIVELRKTIEGLTSEIQQLTSSLTSRKLELESKKANFTSSSQLVKNEIEVNISKLNTYVND